MSDNIIEKPSHYARHDIQPIEFIAANNMEFWRGNIIKYASRAGHKLYDGKTAIESEITDMRKVIQYAQFRINLLEGRGVLENNEQSGPGKKTD